MPPKKSALGRFTAAARRLRSARQSNAAEAGTSHGTEEADNTGSSAQARSSASAVEEQAQKRSLRPPTRSSTSAAGASTSDGTGGTQFPLRAANWEERRREQKRQQTAEARRNETTVQTQQRQERNRDQTAEARRNETTVQTQQRQERDRDQTAEARRNETTVQTQQRQERDRDQTAEARRNETTVQTQQRQERDRDQTAEARRNETTGEAGVRREDDRRRHRERTAAYRFIEQDVAHDESEQAIGPPPWALSFALNYDPTFVYSSHPKLAIERMSKKCQHCNALRWANETPGMCCSNGKVRLTPLNENLPDYLRHLLLGNSEESDHFLSNIRRYNSCFQFTSFGAERIVEEPGFMPTFKVQGQVYHLVGSLLPLQGEEPKFLQIYFMGDSHEEVERRCRIAPGVRPNIVFELQEIMHAHNKYVRDFKTAMERLPPNVEELRVVIHATKTPAGQHERRFNAPVVDDVAIQIVGQQFEKRDIVLELRSSQLTRISEMHRGYDALQYPLIFWEGEDGYHFDIRQTDIRTGNPSATKKVSAMDFYAYRLMVREGSFNCILRCRKLLLQFAVDMYAKIECERLNFIRFNQKKLRVEEYIHLRDAIAGERNPNEIGQMVILPSSFTGGPRYMHERTQDAMTYVRKYGRPDLFITFTCNSAWNELKSELMPGQQSQDRHDLVARVFQLKLKQLMEFITKGAIFGPTRCDMYTIEWQKRGLPHAHILIWLRNRIRPNQIDSVIRAEIPDPDEDPQLYQIVTRQMIHGPCGRLKPDSPCMVDGRCSKKFPKALLRETVTGEDGYPLYRRRSPEDGGFTFPIILRANGQTEEVNLDNRWVVPYCPLLSKVFNAHINVEYCNSVKSIKYICKYVNKGSDQAVFGLERQGAERDEVARYESGRYISSNEAMWRIFGFSIHERHPTVVHLSVHLENGQRVYFTEQNMMQRGQRPPDTTLTAFFKLCAEDAFARTLLYHQVPTYYTWNASSKSWKRRVQGAAVPGHPGMRQTDALSRVYTVHPNHRECFYLRMLLHNVVGPLSFQHIKTVEGQICLTYQEACHRMGLLEDDAQWRSTMQEASVVRSAGQMRDLFAILIATCGLSNPLQLWEDFKEDMAEDILHRARQLLQEQELPFTEAVFNEALLRIEDKVLELTDRPLHIFGLPTPARHQQENLSREMLRETSFDREQLRQFIEENEPRLLPEQAEAYQEVLRRVNDNLGGILFLDAPGGTGKTFLINLLLSKVRHGGDIAIAVASSGIAATLLPGGRTAHSALKLPLDLSRVENPLCNIKKNSGTARVLQACKLIVWDECTMSHKLAFEALNLTLKDLRSNNQLMGGVTLLLSGDFRQTLPVIPRGTPADEINACLKSSHLWPSVEKLHLRTNMRAAVYGDETAHQFSINLLRIGDGQLEVSPEDGLSPIAAFGTIVSSVQELKAKVYLNLSHRFSDINWLSERAILCPRNDAANGINSQLLNELPGNTTSYKSIDTTMTDDNAVEFPIEFLNSLEPPGTPSHNLQLKVGAPIMLLRNLNAPKLCNGTRLIVKQLFPNVIEATIVTGSGKGQSVFIPRIPIIPSDLPFQFKRVQFPVKVCFAMTINKAQGQSLKVAGINLESPCFSHGQLYVACSRVGTPAGLFILAPRGRTRNLVYPQALR
ncbi:hypothetical protein BOX15_Mlig017082g4 [Macrostomum lignano]|uniref:ATP-dependent DNA helicase n=1 Tax=Macrostomum lignano TaxID=282301 RepID=A0A267GEW9_9PLAT|nr:hypothetical protein BOX15_Mlig017082g4 [Macrostomum lignano]